MLTQLFATRPRLELAFLQLQKDWGKLPIFSPQLYFEDFDELPVTLWELPTGPWSSPIADVVLLVKLALCTRPRRLLEVGSFRGYATKLLAAHTQKDSVIVAVDRDPRHGEAYRGLPEAAKIERRVGEVGPEAFATDAAGSYDLIFLDADHSYAAVRRDTELLLPLLAPDGLFIWHDYANWGRVSGRNGVPQYLHEIAATRRLGWVQGTWLGIYSPQWDDEPGARRFDAALVRSGAEHVDVWETDALRG